MLWMVAFKESTAPEDTQTFLLHSIPRISLALFTEFLAYFFLSLYKAAANEIRYFHNEMTNQEAKNAALLAATQAKTQSTITEALQAFLTTERNFILHKDQTTVGLQEKKLEGQAAAKVEDIVAKLIDALKKT